MANKTKRVIHAGGIFPDPLLNREGAAAADTKPGIVGFFDAAGLFKAAVDGKEAAILYVANMDYLRCKGVDDDLKAGDWVVSIQPLQGLFLNVRAAAGTYKKGQAVIIANGQITAVTAAEGEVVFAYVEEDSALTAKAGDLVRVVFK